MSTLTPEQRAAICGGIGKDWDEVLVRDVNAFRAGMRYQHERTREAAAKAVYSGIACPVENCERCEDAKYAAARIRALTLDEC